jgi:hypothetical protein
MLDHAHKRASLVICNDGRSSVLNQSAMLALQLLESS